jgi:hypothetical protein
MASLPPRARADTEAADPAGRAEDADPASNPVALPTPGVAPGIMSSRAGQTDPDRTLPPVIVPDPPPPVAEEDPFADPPRSRAGLWVMAAIVVLLGLGIGAAGAAWAAWTWVLPALEGGGAGPAPSGATASGPGVPTPATSTPASSPGGSAGDGSSGPGATGLGAASGSSSGSGSGAASDDRAGAPGDGSGATAAGSDAPTDAAIMAGSGAAPDAAPPASPAAALPLRFRSLARGTARLTVSCDGVTAEGVDLAGFERDRAGSCTVKAMLQDRTRLYAEVQDVKAGEWRCFADGERSCTR